MKIALVGAGNWGKNLLRNFANQPRATLAAVCDLSESVRQRVARDYPSTRVTDDFDTVLVDKSIAAVAIAVEAPHHFKLAKAALEAGKHVYVEKPLTLTADDAEALVTLAKARGLKLMVGHLLEYHPAVGYMKDAIAEVDPLYLYCQRVNLGIVRDKENAWWSLAPHDISVACYLFGQEPVTVSATGQCYLRPGVEDVVFASLTFPDGRMAHIHVSWLDPHKIRKVTLVGSKKMIVFDDMEAAEKVRVYDKGAAVKDGFASYADAISLRTGDILIPKIPGGEPLSTECGHFIDAILDDFTPRSDGEDGLRVVRVLEAGSRSLARGGAPVCVKKLEPVALDASGNGNGNGNGHRTLLGSYEMVTKVSSQHQLQGAGRNE